MMTDEIASGGKMAATSEEAAPVVSGAPSVAATPGTASPAAAPAPSLRPSLWTVVPACLAALFALMSAVVGVLNYRQAREEKRFQVEPRVLWDVGAFREGQDWVFAVG